MAAHDEPAKDASDRPAPAPPELRWADELGYRAAADDRRQWRVDHADAFKSQMWIGIGAGIMALVTWVLAILATNGQAVAAVSAVFGSALAAWAAGSIAKYRTGGFLVGLILAVVTALMITGCGVAVICSGLR